MKATDIRKQPGLWAILFLLIYCCPFSLPAQIVNIESQRLQTDSVRFVLMGDGSMSFRETDGERFSALLFNLTAHIKSKSLKNLFIVLGGVDVSSLNQTLISKNTMAHLRYNRRVNKWLRWEAFTQYQTNPLTGIDYRILAGFGPRFKVKREGTTFFYVGILYMYEVERIIQDKNPDGRFHRITSYVSLSNRHRADRYEVTAVGYYQPSIFFPKDFRVTLQASLAVKLHRNFALLGMFSGYYDSMPPEKFIPWTYMNTWGFRVNF